MNSWTEPSTSSSNSGTINVSAFGLRSAGRRCICFGLAKRQALDNWKKAAKPSLFVCKAEDNGSKTTEQKQAEETIKRTLAGLDALLGIDPEEEAKKKAIEAEQNGRKPDKVDITFSKEVLEQLAKAESGRLAQGGTKEEKEKIDKEIAERMAKIMENARKLSEETSKNEGKPGVERNLDQLFVTLMQEGGISKEHQQRIKQKVFEQTSFYVTEIQPQSRLLTRSLQSPNAVPQDLVSGSILVRGNLRAPREEAFQKICQNLEKEFGNEYTAVMVLDPLAEADDGKGQPRVAFQIANSAFVQPQEAKRWQWGLALVLGGLTLATAFQLGLTANISKLPKEVIDFIAQPDSLRGEVPANVEDYDAVPFLLSALPISLAVLGVQYAHETAHRVVAGAKNVKLGIPILLPNAQLGLFGAITQLKSMVKSRKDLFDISAAGLITGAVVSAGLFGTGLALTSGAQSGDLLPVPSALLDGSLLLGSLTHLILGDSASGANVSLHPLLIAGWCGLVTTALNSLPVGSLDGGRLMQAAFGRNLLGVTSFFTYVGLGLGFLGSGLALPFGIFVLLCQRDPEKYIQDTVSPTDQARQTTAAVIIATAVLILLPMLPGAAGLGGGGLNL